MLIKPCNMLSCDGTRLINIGYLAKHTGTINEICSEEICSIIEEAKRMEEENYFDVRQVTAIVCVTKTYDAKTVKMAFSLMSLNRL